ncbi:hypothetical protein FHR33_002815 [Nonomuraea dietziae]|uniref:Uncharacterized protein n=1 Tax=Nonomuraea dietziae TaxID=65515 RepID=A0A7W5V8P6_9ACTN|nr:hypothetical protein [Nonomuraea dietziae]
MLSSEVPSSSRIMDFTLVGAPAGPLVVCADSRYGGVWTWDPLRDVWQQERPLTFEPGTRWPPGIPMLRTVSIRWPQSWPADV